MTVRFDCTHCNKRLKAEERHAGKMLICPKCGGEVYIPALSSEASPEGPDSQKTPSQDEDGAVGFSRRHVGDDELDMTPMIDCVFLLLIFFLVTASFALQKSLRIPPPDAENAAAQTTAEELENDDDFVTIRIDKDNTIWINDSVCPSQQEIISRLKEAKAGDEGGAKGPNSVLVMASGECHHESVVMALDSASAAGMEGARLLTLSDDDDF